MSRTYYQYITLPRRRNPSVTAYQAEESGGSVTIRLGASFCHNRDRFNRTLGRQIAEGRMSSVPRTFSFKRDDRPFHIQIASMVEDYIRNHGGLVTSSLTTPYTANGVESSVVTYTVPISLTVASAGW